MISHLAIACDLQEEVLSGDELLSPFKHFTQKNS
jgi:hypothetical protein